ncbi:MAG: methylglyoxal synthase [Verrucomicrobiota bacterium JB023]|nr:methylglyoxal synthase [Verrucomicrobiota bacterium JB023]
MKIALVAHDQKKDEMVRWGQKWRSELARHELCATGTTGGILARELDLPIERFRSGPLGGDLQLGAAISEGEIEMLVFFWDPLESQPHDPDIRALLRVAVVWNIPVATNPASADFILSSPLMKGDYERENPDFTEHLERFEPGRKVEAS